jgi:hypothetical protein
MARPAEPARPHKLKGFWLLVRRVPEEFRAYDTRNPVRISTGIRIVDDPRGIRAGEVVSKLHADLMLLAICENSVPMRPRNTNIAIPVPV